MLEDRVDWFRWDELFVLKVAIVPDMMEESLPFIWINYVFSISCIFSILSTMFKFMDW